MRIILVLILLASCYASVGTAWAQVELRPDKEWYRPDTTKEGKVYRNLNKDFKVVMGDTTLSEVKPSFTLQAFSDQPIPASMKLHMMNTNPDSNWVRGDSFYVKNSHITYRTYMKSETELEWEIILREKPKTNVFSYDIETENLSFHYQDSTTDVPGSYAVYHSSKANNRTIINSKDTTYENYMTGKALQIPRPTAWDVTGDSIGAFQVFDVLASAMTIVVDSVWLDKATYPVTIGPTFGYSTIGGSGATLTGGCRALLLEADIHTASTGDVVTQLHWYGREADAESIIELAVYTYDGGLPVTRVHAPESLTVDDPVTPQWWDSDVVSVALTNGITYTVAFSVTGSARYYYNSETDAESYDASALLPATWSSGGKFTPRPSMYVTYTAGGAAPINYKRRRIGINQ